VTETPVVGHARSRAPDVDAAPGPAPTLGRAGILLGLVSGVALAGLGGSIAFGVMWAHDRGAASDQADAHTVASEFLLALTNFGPKTLESDFDRMQALATAPFAAQVRQNMPAQLRTQLVAAQVQTQGRIKHLWVQSYSGSAASFFGEVDQTFRNNKSPVVHSDTLRVEVDLSKVDGQWKIGQVTTIGSGSAPALPGG
jgi:hypothetical protein